MYENLIFFFHNFRYRGHVLLIVNVASKCGLTATNYKELNELQDKYAESQGNFWLLMWLHAEKIKNLRIYLYGTNFLGLRILAFPCNQFNGQEPGSSEDICSFADHQKVSNHNY